MSTEATSDTGLTRRQALVAAAALCGAGTLGAVSASDADAAARIKVRISKYPALQRVGGVALVGLLNGRQVAVVRASAKKYAAVDRTCPHAGATVITEGAGWLCPLHGSRFDVDGDRISGPTPSGLRKLRVKRKRDVLTITG